MRHLHCRYPRLDIELASDFRSISLERHEADIAIRFARTKNGDVISRPLVTVGLGFYGTDEACRSVEAGADPVLIGFDEAEAYLSGATWLTRQFPRMRLAGVVRLMGRECS
jgi:DNA-binding transcriptional LysR family regulator